MPNKSEINIPYATKSQISVNVTQINNSSDLEEKKEHLETTKKYFAKLTLSDEDYLPTSQKINELETAIKLYEKTLQDTAKVLEREKDNKDLKEIKKYIEQGSIDLARKWFEENKEKLVEEENQSKEKRKVISNKYLTWALLTQNNYNNLNWFEDTRKYFETSINNYETQYNLYLFGYFFSTVNYYQEAQKYWKKCLTKFISQMTLEEESEITNNLAVISINFGEVKEAKQLYEKSLSLSRKIHKKKQSNESEINLGYVLNNFGLFLIEIKKYDRAKKLLLEALKIRKKIVQETVKSSFELSECLSITQLNLGFLFHKSNDFENAKNYYAESEKTILTVTEENIFFGFLQLVKINFNLGDLSELSNSNEEALNYYNTAYEFSLPLLEIGKLIALPDVLRVFSKLARFYKTKIINKENSINFAFNTVSLATPVVKEMPQIFSDLINTTLVLNDWGFSNEKIDMIIQEAKSDEL